MTRSPARIATATALFTLVAAGSGCATATDAVVQTPHAKTAEAGAVGEDGAPAGGARGPARTEGERHFLDDLAAFGLPTEMTAATTVEVGIGICEGIADGADDETILDRIRPLTSAMAAQDSGRDTAEVGRAIVDASRAHLCE